MRDGSTGAARRGQGGFALLVSLIAIVGLTALATGGFLLASSERQVSSNHQAVVEAFYLANAGLNDYLGTQSGEPPAGPTTYGPFVYEDGSATVTVTRVSTTGDPGDPGLYQITSEGRFDPTGAGNPVIRAVNALALLDPTTVPDFDAAVTSGAGVRKRGDSGEIDGRDACGLESARAGLRVPEEGYEQNGSGEVVFGDPPVEEIADPLDFDGDGSTDDEERWWNGMLDGTGVDHDYVVEDGDFPDTGGEGMPVTYVDRDDVSLGPEASGQGLLIVRGGAELLGGFDWDGIILVGGSITDDGVGEVEGAVITGLNRLRGETVGADDLEDDTGGDDGLEGTRSFQFHSCYVEQVQRASALLAQVPGTWHERM